MKSRVLVGSLAVMLLLLTGCGGTQTLVCTQTQEEDGMTMTTEMNVAFQNDEASEFTMTADMKVDDTYIDYMDQFESIMKESFSTFEEDGMDVTIESKDTTITATVSANFNEMTEDEKEQIGFTSSDNSYDDVKQSLEDSGFTCK